MEIKSHLVTEKSFVEWKLYEDLSKRGTVRDTICGLSEKKSLMSRDAYTDACFRVSW